MKIRGKFTEIYVKQKKQIYFLNTNCHKLTMKQSSAYEVKANYS